MVKAKTHNRLAFLIYALLLGVIIGALTWGFLWAMNFVIELIWVDLAEQVNLVFFPVVVCMAGGALVGLCQKYFGSVPGVLSIELDNIKKTKRVDYKNLPAVALSSFIPLVFGGSIGPEAALVSILGGLSTWMADHIKSMAKYVRGLTEVGATAALSAMFGSPFFAIAELFEKREKSFLNTDKPDKKTADENDVLPKNDKAIIYFVTALAGFGIFSLLSTWFPESGISRYDYTPYSTNEWLAILPLALVSSAVGYLYYLSGIVIKKCIGPIKNRKILLGIIGGIFLGVVGMFVPYTMFSGETQIAQIQSEWITIPAVVLILTALLKIFISRLCFLTGWRGGHIFPVIFAGLVLGYGLSYFIPVDPVFCALVCSASVTCMVLRKPVAVVLLYLIICPVEYLIPLSIAAVISIMLPFPKMFEQAEEDEIKEELALKKKPVSV